MHLHFSTLEACPKFILRPPKAYFKNLMSRFCIPATKAMKRQNRFLRTLNSIFSRSKTEFGHTLSYYSKKIILFLFLCFSSGITANLFGQDQKPQKELYIEMNKGKNYVGTIVNRDSNAVFITTRKNITISLPIERIRLVSETRKEQSVGHSFWPDRQQSTLQNSTPNAFALKEGEIHFSNFYVFFNQINIGITDNFSMSSGFGLTSLFNDHSILWMVPKFTVPVHRFLRLGVGSYLVVDYENKESGYPNAFGYPFAVITFGKPNLNLSFGFGSSFSEDGWDQQPIRTISGNARLGKNFYFKIENLIVIDEKEIDYSITFVGLKSVWPRFSVDYGFLMNIEPNDEIFFIPVPLLTMTYSFQNKPSNIHLIK